MSDLQDLTESKPQKLLLAQAERLTKSLDERHLPADHRLSAFCRRTPRMAALGSPQFENSGDDLEHQVSINPTDHGDIVASQ